MDENQPAVTRYEAMLKAVETTACVSTFSSLFLGFLRNTDSHTITKIRDGIGGAIITPPIALLFNDLTNSRPCLGSELDSSRTFLVVMSALAADCG
jgi:hypothetical protein